MAGEKRQQMINAAPATQKNDPQVAIMIEMAEERGWEIWGFYGSRRGPRMMAIGERDDGSEIWGVWGIAEDLSTLRLIGSFAA